MKRQKGITMVKENIVLCDDLKFPMSLRTLPLTPDCSGRIEYIFYCVNLARDFDDLSSLLERVLDCPFTELKRDNCRILYEVMINDEPCSLMFKVKAREELEAA